MRSPILCGSQGAVKFALITLLFSEQTQSITEFHREKNSLPNALNPGYIHLSQSRFYSKIRAGISSL